MKKLPLILLIAAIIWACKTNNNYKKDNSDLLRKTVDQVTQVMVHDIFSPPVASRIYFLCSLAAYEAAVPSDSSYKSMVGQLNGFEKIPKPAAGQVIDYDIASKAAYYKMGKTLTFSVEKFDEFDIAQNKLLDQIGIPGNILKESIAYGEAVADAVNEYSKKDNYKQTRGFRYTVTQEPDKWVPTPPAYMDAVEPFWSTIRPATLDSAAQFAPALPPVFNIKDKSSAYFKALNEVYTTVKNLTEEQREIANFWDCNPFKMNVTGHAMFATKKISPGGHWMSIVNQVTTAKKLNTVQTAEALLLTSIAIYDGFISCWDQKYKSRNIRPETVINTHLDKDWIPTLQTPPFPEYTSGHSVISGAASVSLTKLFGDNFAFVDSTETQFGLPVRKYQSFAQAAEEASISRLYGGIHFRPALDNGLAQGRKVGEWINGKLKTRK